MRSPIKVRRLAAVLALVAVAVTAAVSASAQTARPQAQFVLGVSNTLVGNGWREEMICAVKAQALASGVVSDVKVANRNGGPAEQIADIRSLISGGANAIIINPSSATALNAVIAQANSRGVKCSSSARSERTGITAPAGAYWRNIMMHSLTRTEPIASSPVAGQDRSHCRARRRRRQRKNPRPV